MHTACFFSIIIYYYSPLPIYTMEYIREYKYYSGEKLDKIDGMWENAVCKLSSTYNKLF